MAYLTFLAIVLFAAVVSFIIGWAWYSQALFGPLWMKELNLRKEMMDGKKDKMMKTMGMMFFASVVKAFCLIFLSVLTTSNQFFLAFVIWLGFILPVLLSHSLFEKRSWNLFMISAGNELVSLVAMGFVFYII